MTDLQAQSGQRTSLLLAMATAALMIVQQIGAKTTRDTFFLSHHPASELPKVMIGAALASLIGALIFSQLLRRFGPASTLPGTYALHATLFLLEWWFIDRMPALMSIVLYLHIGTLGPVVISGFWSLVNEQFDPHTAKRFVGRIAGSAAFGGVLGGVVSERLIANFPLSTMLPVLAGVTLLGSLLCRCVGRASTTPSETSIPGTGLKALGSRRYLRNMAIVVLVTSTTAGLLDYVLRAEAANALKDAEALGSFFALFHATLSVLVFFVQSTFSSRSLQKLGIGGTLAALPAAVLVGGVLSAAATRLWTVALLSGLENTLRNSLFRSGYELLYTPVEKSRKRSVKTVVDVAFDRFGDIAAASLALLCLAFLPEHANRLAIALAAGAAGVGLVLSLRLHQGYVNELAASLRSGTLHVDDVEGLDRTTQRTLTDTTMAIDRDEMLAEIRALQAARAQPLHAVDGDALIHEEPQQLLDQVRTLLVGGEAEIRKLLESGAEAEHFESRLLPFVIPILARRPLVRPCIALLQKHAKNREGLLLDALLDRSQPDSIRRRLPRVLRELVTERSRDGLLAALDDSNFAVRYSAAQALFSLTSQHPQLAPSRERVFAYVSREADVSLQEFDDITGTDETDSLRPPPLHPRPAARLEYVFMLLSTVLKPEPLELCLKALTTGDPTLHGTALEYLENVLPGQIYSSLAQHLLATASVRRQAREGQPPQVVRQLHDELHQSMSNLKLDVDALKKARSAKKP